MATAKKAKAAKKDARPKVDFTGITQRGLKAQELAAKHQAELGARVASSVTAGLAADIAALGAAVPKALTTHHEAVQVTAAQNAALAKGHALVSAARAAVKGQRPEKSVLLAYGVGATTNARIVKHVKNALQKIVDRATAQPQEAASFGIVASDVTAMKQQIVAIDQADQAQELARAKAPATTKERNMIGNRILAAVQLISGAGQLAFSDDATVRAAFAALTRKVK